MPLPFFPPTDDPGPDFAGLIRRLRSPRAPDGARRPGPAARRLAEVRHGTTVVALRFAEGIVMAGDRRATEATPSPTGRWRRSSRPTATRRWPSPGRPARRWRWSGCSRPSWSTTRRSKAWSCSLEGKANQLGQMVREHLPWPCRAWRWSPLFAGYDLARGTGRIFTYDVTGGHYEETEHNATGSGGRDARTTIKLGYREGMARDDAVELAIEALYEAADEDSATGGPDLVRGIYPLVATVTADGFQPWPRSEVGRALRRADRAAPGGGSAAMTMPYYVAPEQVMKDRAEYAQKGIARGRSLVATVYDDGIVIVAENPSRSLHKISEIYDRIAFAGVGKYNEFDQLRVSGIRHADTKGYAYSREDVDARSLANLYAQYLGQVFTHEMKPLEVEILVAELGTGRRPDSCTTSPTRGRSPTRTATRCSGARPRPSPSGSRRPGGPTGRWRRRCRPRSAPWPARTGRWAGTDLEAAVLHRATGAGPSADWASDGERSPCSA